MTRSDFAFQQVARGAERVLRAADSASGSFSAAVATDKGLQLLQRVQQAAGSSRRSRWRRLLDRPFLETGDDFVLGSGNDLVVLLSVFEEVGNVEESVALQADIDERRLHSRQDLRHLPL